ncbi:hypothetical protein INT43_005621 [Umbelopsis isabellina]|uniref:HD/PDEase domain-containing protein n=1 Tax=Mortierella isabellina TaxID=91625 RepID=A0A8H7PLV0_MORIS|nr:hypothetical protein INT43_005621 [Umbelopsis isabellina]
MTADTVIHKAEDMVKEYMSRFDSSHDYLHVDRVRRTALHIAKLNGGDLEIVELAALFHDVADAKYAQNHVRYRTGSEIVIEFLLQSGYDHARARLVGRIVDNIGFRKELGWSSNDDPEFISWRESCLEMHAVQDADKLDAIGAFGVLRCAAFSGARNIALFNPADAPIEGMTKEQYEQQTASGGGSSINHFHEKLFKLKFMMRTPTGQKMAEKRHQFMHDFVDQIQQEYALTT